MDLAFASHTTTSSQPRQQYQMWADSGKSVWKLATPDHYGEEKGKKVVSLMGTYRAAALPISRGCHLHRNRVDSVRLAKSSGEPLESETATSREEQYAKPTRPSQRGLRASLRLLHRQLGHVEALRSQGSNQPLKG